MFPARPPLDAVRLTIVDRTPELDPSWMFQAEVREVGFPFRTLTADIWYGLMVDFTPTWASEVACSFMYGDGAQDVFKTARSVTKAARHHHEDRHGY